MGTTARRPVALVVLDGWGYRAEREGNAIALAGTPTWDRLWARTPRTLLRASGLAVGLPAGQMGNSEVGHLNLGAGRVVMQDLVRISQAIHDGSFFQAAAFVDACAHVHKTGGTLHLVGLIGDGGVHGLDRHAWALVDLAQRQGVAKVAIHALLDGRDTMPTSSLEHMPQLLARTAGVAVVASVSGRYYAMDRDRRWPRTEVAYRAIAEGVGPTAPDPMRCIRDAHARGETDEFVVPHVMVDAEGRPVAPMRDGDAVLCWNYRSDRMRQLVRALAVEGFDGFPVPARPRVHLATMTQYDATFPFPSAFPPFSMARIVAEVVSEAGRSMLRTAETEKYPHVTFFFNGGHEQPLPGEDRRVVPSPKVATYDLQPEMSAGAVCAVLCDALANRTHDFMLCNFANTDMVGHTGSLEAAITAVEAVDACLGQVLEAAAAGGARLIITADHGNAELMRDPITHEPHTAHTTNPVKLILFNHPAIQTLRDGRLGDVAPTVLALLGLPQPASMTGQSLLAANGKIHAA